MEENKRENMGDFKGFIKEVWSWIYCIVIAVGLVLIVKHFLFSTTIVKGSSMYPTLEGEATISNDVLIIDRLSQVRKISLERGNIVVIEAPNLIVKDNKAQYQEENLIGKIKKLFSKTLYVKRVIGLPGEHMKIERNAIYINGEKLNEPYVNAENSSNGATREFVVPEGYVFCMGDNRGSSSDSRVFGAVPIEKVEGRIILRVYPFNRFGKAD